MKYILNHLDTCTPDHFPGHSGHVENMSVDGDTTWADVKAWLRDDAWADQPEMDWKALEEAIEVYIKVVESGGTLDGTPVFPRLDKRDSLTDQYEVYAYFGLTEEED